MRKQQQADKGFEKLLGAHTKALRDNSDSVIEILELLQGKKLSPKDKKELKAIKRELKGIDDRLNSLGQDSDDYLGDIYGI